MRGSILAVLALALVAGMAPLAGASTVYLAAETVRDLARDVPAAAPVLVPTSEDPGDVAAGPVRVASRPLVEPVEWAADVPPPAIDDLGGSPAASCAPWCASVPAADEPGSRGGARSAPDSAPAARTPALALAPAPLPREAADPPRAAPPAVAAVRAPGPRDADAKDTRAEAVTGAAVAAVTLGLLALYRRITNDRALGLPARAGLNAIVATRPGLTETELARATGLHRTTVHDHLRVLRSAGLVVIVRTRGRNRHYSPGEPGRAAHAESATTPAVAARLEALARERPGVPVADAARALGVRRALAHHHARALAAAGRLTLDRDALGRVRCRAAG